MGKKNELPPRYTHDWIESLDQRTSLARAVRDRLQRLEADMGGGDSLSYQRRSLAKRAIFMEALIEQREAAIARGEDVDQGQLTQATNTLIGLLKTIGLDRRARDLTPAEYLRSRAS
ncbi:hypothetical protein GJ672_03535 [Spiribacter sp. 2438]|uniref:hypothetical protein n=1 Tax=Spiribacter sp. 2438 TaxID=2666185 RepID=UPI0012B047B3|nr:hypothetical protein [Spiribacter sp. 2438]QGM21430.1 hypothetical protein GJ672_03535 [Spiribacter sp. 2438]